MGPRWAIAGSWLVVSVLVGEACVDDVPATTQEARSLTSTSSPQLVATTSSTSARATSAFRIESTDGCVVIVDSQDDVVGDPYCVDIELTPGDLPEREFGTAIDDGHLTVVELPPGAELVAVEVGALADEHPPYVLIALAPDEASPVIVFANHRGNELRCDYRVLVPTCTNS